MKKKEELKEILDLAWKIRNNSTPKEGVPDPEEYWEGWYFLIKDLQELISKSEWSLGVLENFIESKNEQNNEK